MKRSEELKRSLATKLERMEALSNSAVNEKGEVRKLLKEEQDEFTKLEGEVKDIEEAIKRELEIEKRKALVSDLDSAVVAAPVVKITKDENDDENGVVQVYKGRGSFGAFLQDVKRQADTGRCSDRLEKLRAATGANETIGSDGGFLIQPDHADMLFTASKDSGTLAARCLSVPVSGNSTTINLVDETSLADGSQFGGVKSSWRAEATQVSPTRPKFRIENVRLDVLESLFYATEEQLEDAGQLEAFANVAFATSMGWKLDDAIINGTGAGMPLGVLNSTCLIPIAKEASQTTSTVIYQNVDKMVDRMLPGSTEPVWYVHPDVVQQLRGMFWKGGSTTEYPVYLPYQAGADASKTGNLLGYAVEKKQQCKALGSVGDIIFGDFSKYALFRKRGILASQSAHVAFLTSERVFKWNLRAGGMPLFNKPITDAYGSTTRSPFIALAVRP
jgi:HK97 family phage major capsid protein